MEWALEELPLELRVNWKISRNETQSKLNFLIKCKRDGQIGRGEVAPNIRYGETPQLVQEQYIQFIAENTDEKEFLNSLDSADICHSLKFGLESAFLNQPLENDIEVETSYSIPIMDPSSLSEYLEPLKRFRSLKLKVDKDSADELLKQYFKLTHQPLRIDGNEAWENPDDVLSLMKKYQDKPIQFFEQPIPAKLIEEQKYLFSKTPFELIADESVEDTADFDSLRKQFHGINIKLMKTGGVRKAKELMTKAKENNLKVMLGCMIETSLGISLGMGLASQIDYFDLDGFLLLKDDPFKLLQENNGLLRPATNKN